MPTIRIIRAVTEPGNRGPSRGQFAMQRALAANNLDWLEIGGQLKYGEIPWIWSYEDQAMAVAFADLEFPLICGPNFLFSNSRKPCQYPHELKLCNAGSCVMLITESDWYAQLIRKYCGANKAPISVVPYPIDPLPEGPLVAKTDVLLYIKTPGIMPDLRTVQRGGWKNIAVFTYGHYQRDELIAAARRSRVCLYVSDDDRGPLAAAEIAIAGCPLVGTERGCPWTLLPNIGVEISKFDDECVQAGIAEATALDRKDVRKAAMAFWDTNRIVNALLDALRPIALEKQLTQLPAWCKLCFRNFQ